MIPLKEYRVIGKDMPNDQARGKVTGKLKYCSDMRGHGMLYMRLKPSTVTHGMVRAVHAEKALALPGVVAVYSCENTPETFYDRGRVGPWESVPNQERLFDRHVRYMGERVAAVVAVTEEIAEDACRLIDVEYDVLPHVISVADAQKPDAPQLHNTGNVYPAASVDFGDFDGVQGALCHTSQSHIGRMTHLCMETHSCRASYDPSDEVLTVWSGCQSVFGVRSTVADLLGLPYARVRVVKVPMGGSFGVKQETLLEPLTAYASYDLEADVRLVYTREETIVNTMMKHSLDATVTSKVTPDGFIQGVSVSATLDAGAYLTVSRDYASTMGEKLNKVYHFLNGHFDGKAVCTNTPINGSFRSWGSCEMVLCLENHWNMVARELGMDPVDFRLKNVHAPYEDELVHNVSVGNAHFRECLLQGREQFRWDQRKEECARENAAQRRYRYGVGVAMASHTSSFYPYRVDVASSTARLQEDGSLIVTVAVHDHGCGTVLAMKKIASEVTEIPVDRIVLREADTENSQYDHGCYASRSVYSLGQSVKTCCEKLMDQARKCAAGALDCSDSFLQYENGEFYEEAHKDHRISLPKVAEHSIRMLGRDICCSTTTNATVNPGVPAVHFTHVQVDTYTGFVKVLDCLSVHDIGKAINPDLCRGQVGSGIQQGMGMALCEEIKIHPKTGEALITNFKNYEVANACDMPDYQVLFIEDPEPDAPFGAKSIGEVVLPPVAPAVVAAVNDALGTQLRHLPLTPSVILDALEEQNL